MWYDLDRTYRGYRTWMCVRNTLTSQFCLFRNRTYRGYRTRVCGYDEEPNYLIRFPHNRYRSYRTYRGYRTLRDKKR